MGVYIYIAPIEGGQGEGSSKFGGKMLSLDFVDVVLEMIVYNQDLDLGILKIIQHTVTVTSVTLPETHSGFNAWKM